MKTIKSPVGLRCISGQQCPLSGTWWVEGLTAEARREIGEGQPMPLYGGHPVCWVLVSH